VKDKEGEMPRRARNKRANGEGTIYKRKDGRWCGEVTIGKGPNGRQLRKVVYGRTKAEAARKRDELKALSPVVLKAEKMSVADFLRRWLQQKEPSVRPRTFSDYKYTVENYIIPKLGGYRLDRLEPEHIDAMIAKLYSEVSADRANKARRLLFSALKQAVRWGKIPVNPAEKTDPLPQERREMVLWTPEQTTRFISTCKTYFPHAHYHIFYLAMSSGLRCGELLGLEWDDLKGNVLHVQRSLIHIRGKLHLSAPKTKSGVRRVTLAPDVLEVLEDHRERQAAQRKYMGEAYQDSGIMFASEVGSHIHPRNLKRTWDALQSKVRHFWVGEARYTDLYGEEETVRLDKQGKLLPRLTIHDLRHLHVSLCIRDGMNPKQVAARVGHKNASLTMNVYTHLFEEQNAQNPVSLLSLAEPRTLN
jgi:integrase